MPSFTNNVIDQAYENFMKQIPGFHREPAEAETIQKDIKNRRSVVQMIFRNDAHGVLFEKKYDFTRAAVKNNRSLFY